MILSKKSWHYWFYSKFYWRTPTNLCPYFWKTVLSIVLLLPLFIFCIPLRTGSHIFDCKDGKKGTIWEVFGAAVATNIAAFLFVGMVAFWWVVQKSTWWSVGFVGYGVTGTILLFFVVDKIQRSIKWKKSGRPNILKEFIKAKKQKYCPVIEWEDEDKRA